MSKKLKIVKLITLTSFYLTYIVAILIKPFKLKFYKGKSITTSIFSNEFQQYFPSIKTFMMVILVIMFMALVMLGICIFGEFNQNPSKGSKKFLKAFGYNLEDKDIKQFTYILSGVIIVNLALHGITYKGNTMLEVKLSCMTPTFLILICFMILTIIVVNLSGTRKKRDREECL